MKTSIATVSIAGELPEKLAAISAAGFDGIEIFEQDFIAYDGSPREVGNMIRDHGLEITLFQPFRDFEGLPEPHRQRAFDRAEHKFDLMEELGTDLILICSSVHPEALGGIDRMAADFSALGDLAAGRGLRVGYEALAWGKHIFDHRDAWEVVRAADHPNVGLILDSFHTLARDIDPDSIRRIPAEKIFFVQLADAPRIEMDLLYWSRHFRNMPGEGDLDVTRFMRAVSATGYDGPVSLEIFNDQFRGGSPRTIAIDGKRSLLFLMDQIKNAEPGFKIDVPDMPPRVSVDGVEYVEFTADQKQAETLGSLLKEVGFAKVGVHKNKSVTLWRQGGINIVLNSEPVGFAHSSYIMHGLSVCDIGLRVDDAEATVSRASALGASLFNEPYGERQLDIPAIRGVGGGVIRFIDQGIKLNELWDAEFEETGEVPPQAGLICFDHLAQTMNYEEMLTWTLFYTSIFDVEKAAMVDVVDPGGLVRSRAIEAPNGALRLTLNGAESHRTLAGRFVTDSFGASFQHLAFQADDIMATADKLIGRGFEPLEISANYYDDLTARLDLPPDYIAALQSRNILYDEDDGGAFLQLYSRPFGDGLFCEIVERRDRYMGYGAYNASFRIAAQKRLMPPAAMPEL